MNSKKIKQKILFHGELPPNTIHGISISNKLNLEQLSKHFNILVIEEIWLPSSILKKNFSLFCRILKVIKFSFLYKPHIFYLIYSVSFFGSFKTAFLIFTCKLFSPSTKIVIHLHRGNLVDHLKVTINRYIFKIIDKHIFSYITLSSLQLSELSNFSNKKKFILANSINFDDFQKQNTVPSESVNKLKFLFLSNYLTEKGIFELIEAFKHFHSKYQDTILITHGKFPNKQTQLRLNTLNLSYIEINNFISGQDKINLLKKVDCLILPSYTEGQPLIILEAMALSLPVIVTNVGYISEMVGHDYPFLIPNHSIETIYFYLEKFSFLNLNERINLGKKINKRYIEIFSQTVHENKLLKIFDEILSFQ